MVTIRTLIIFFVSRYVSWTAVSRYSRYVYRCTPNDHQIHFTHNIHDIQRIYIRYALNWNFIYCFSLNFFSNDPIRPKLWTFLTEWHNKANLRDLIAATGLVILLKVDSTHRIFKFDGSKNNRAPLLYYIKFCASFQNHLWIQTGFTVRKCSIRVKIGDFFVLCVLEMWWMISNMANLRDFIAATSLVILLKIGFKSSIFRSMWPSNLMDDLKKTIGHLFWTSSSFVQHFKPIGEFKLQLQSRNAQFGSKLAIFCPVWPWNLMDDLDKQ